ncbi:MAG TPA: glucokinase [Rhizomicrobium sp.]|nr:glucokinase [Rhizomicrobium sp.]
MNRFGLVADAGGTNVRFALVDLDTAAVELCSPRKYTSRNFSSIEEAAAGYLGAQKLSAPPSFAVLSVAGPVADNAINMTNLGWRFSGDEFGKALGIAWVRLINDYEAIAHSALALKDDDLRVIGPSVSVRAGGRRTVAIVGPGTGLGVGGYVRTSQGLVPLVTEGGHSDFAPSDDTEDQVLKFLRDKCGHVSNERILSGPGLMNLHEALSHVEGVRYEKTESHQITAQGLADRNSLYGRVLSRFCAILGSVAGNVALTMGARDGLLLAGGILPVVADFLAASEFRARFEAKGRFESYMKAIPTRLIVNDNAGLIGAAACLKARK